MSLLVFVYDSINDNKESSYRQKIDEHFIYDYHRDDINIIIVDESEDLTNLPIIFQVENYWTEWHWQTVSSWHNVFLNITRLTRLRTQKWWKSLRTCSRSPMNFRTLQIWRRHLDFNVVRQESVGGKTDESVVQYSRDMIDTRLIHVSWRDYDPTHQARSSQTLWHHSVFISINSETESFPRCQLQLSH